MPEKIGRIIGLAFALPIAVVIGLFKVKRVKYNCCHNPDVISSLKEDGVTLVYCTNCGSIHSKHVYKVG